MVLYMQRWVESRYFEVVIEAESADAAEETFDKLQRANETNGMYYDALANIASDYETELECLGVEEVFPWYIHENLTGSEIKRILGE